MRGSARSLSRSDRAVGLLGGGSLKRNLLHPEADYVVTKLAFRLDRDEQMFRHRGLQVQILHCWREGFSSPAS